MDREDLHGSRDRDCQFYRSGCECRLGLGRSPNLSVGKIDGFTRPGCRKDQRRRRQLKGLFSDLDSLENAKSIIARHVLF